MSGGCRCGAVRYSVAAIVRNSICHCRDCQRSAGAPMVEWMLVDEAALEVSGEPASFEGSPGAVRSFCARCGTGLFYRNAAIFPGQVDVQAATLDDPGSVAAPAYQVQRADARDWARRLDSIPAFDRFPAA